LIVILILYNKIEGAFPTGKKHVQEEKNGKIVLLHVLKNQISTREK